MEIFEGIIQLKLPLFLRPVSGGRVIILGVVKDWRKNHSQNDELWNADIQIVPTEKNTIEGIEGYRIDQVVCGGLSEGEISPIKDSNSR